MIKVLILGFILFLTACETARDALTLKKKSSGDEFLVEKKNPLVMPPDYDKLPEPINSQSSQDTNASDEVNIKDLLSNKENILIKEKQNNSSSLEEAILEKIN